MGRPRAHLARRCVALRKESVDRKAHPGRVGAALCWSLSARRAWIENGVPHIRALRLAVALRKESVDRKNPGRAKRPRPVVALRKESVDRKTTTYCCGTLQITSLSARRAWIEMHLAARPFPVRRVALRKESVDRNAGGATITRTAHSRSPQGERG